MEAVPPEMGGASILREEPERSAAGRAQQREGTVRPSGGFRLRAEPSVKGASAVHLNVPICAGKFQSFDRFEAAMRGRVDI